MASLATGSDDRRPEVLVVGAGPAGLCSAIACAERGLDVVVLERRSELPIDKACGEGLMPDAVAHLRDLGVHPAGCEISGIHYIDEHKKASGHFDPVRVGLGLGVRRLELSAVLRDRALELGVELRLGDGVLGLDFLPESDAYSVASDSGIWRPCLVIGADGARSLVRQAVGLDRERTGAVRRVGIRQHFEGLAQDAGPQPVEVFWSEGVEAYWTPVGGGVYGLAFLFGANAAAADPSAGAPVFDRLLQQFPVLRERLQGASTVSRVRGFGPLRCDTKALTRGNVVLVGDAGGYVDAITGEGMAIAFAEATLLARLLAPALNNEVERGMQQVLTQTLRRYRAQAARRRRLPDRLTESVLQLSTRPRLRRRFVAALARRPQLFDDLLALHARAVPDRAVVGLAVRLGGAMLSAGSGR